MGKLQVRKLVLGMVRTNTYLAVNEQTNEMIFIDPADEAARLEEEVMRRRLKPTGILLTHGHFDHIGAAVDLAARYQIDIICGREEEALLSDENRNLSRQFGCLMRLHPDRTYADGDELCLAGFRIKVLHTPGHTEGGVCYYMPEEGVLFSGDTLFYESIGRTDFPTGSRSALVRSVRKILAKLPGETVVYPGHESETTIAHEKEYNPFV